MTTGPIYFVRHGQTDWNAERRFQGQADTDINAIGRDQADRNGQRLAELIGKAPGFDFVASPLRRTCHTMERVRAAMGLPPGGYRTDPRLMELHFGDWQGSTLREVEARVPGSRRARDRDKWNFLPPGAGAESYGMLAARIAPWLEEVREPTVCVTHGGVIRAVLRLVAGLPQDEAGAMDIVQDRVLRLEHGCVDWL